MSRLLRVALSAALVVGVAGGAAQATPASTASCAPEADRLRAHLVEAARNTSRWNLAWTIAFGAAAAGQLALAVTHTNPLGEFDRDYEDTLYVGAAKATVGLASRIVLPLRVDLPPPSSDRCAELQALRASLTVVAKKERRLFWLTHIGGTALNLAGAVILWQRRSFAVGAISFGVSYPVGPISAYTLPRASWKLWRAEGASWATTSWSFGITPHPEQTLITLGGEF